MDITVVKTVTKTIGSLALAYPYLRRLGVAQLIDDLTTRGKEREVSTGQVVEVLVLNRLALKPTPISKIDAWAGEQVIEEIARKKIPEVWLNPGAESDALIARARALRIQPIVGCSIVGIGENPYAL